MITLYATPTCPYSRKVRKTLQALNLNFQEFNIHEKERETELIETGGKRQIPFLEDTEYNAKIYDSDKIIEFLEKTYGNSA